MQRRQLLTGGAAAVATVAAGATAVQAKPALGANDAWLLELEKRHNAMLARGNDLPADLSGEQRDEAMDALTKRADAIAAEMQTISADSIAGLAAKARVAAQTRQPGKDELPLFDRMEYDVLDEVIALAGKGA